MLTFRSTTRQEAGTGAETSPNDVVLMGRPPPQNGGV